MTLTLLPLWAALSLAGGLLAAPLVPATGAPATPPVPSHLTAAGLTQPIGAQIQLAWTPAPQAGSYKVYRDRQFLAVSSRAGWTDYDVSAGEIHTYTVTSLGNAGESQPSAPAAAAVPAGGSAVVYADALQNGWQSVGGANADFGCTTLARAGCAIRVSPGPAQALSLHHAPFSTAAFGALTFWIQGGPQGGQRLWVKALRSGVPQAGVALGPLPAGQWQSVTVSLRALGAANVSDMDGVWVQDASGRAQPPFFLDEIALTAAPHAPAAPAGLTATPQWAASCPQCGGMAMPHIVLAWNAVPGAASYTVYRDGSKAQEGLATPAWTDMSVVSGHAYAYTVTATGLGGESPRSASVSAAAPDPPAAGLLGVPFNVTVSSAWPGALTPYGNPVSNTLTWSPASGAASYNVYQSDILIARGLSTPRFTVTPDLLQRNALYTVTAVDRRGVESLPSAPSGYRSASIPATLLPYNDYTPAAPDALVAVPDWNLAAPRLTVHWHAYGLNPFDVYRDGVRVAGGLWQTYYIDTNLKPGSTHTYTVVAVNTDWLPQIQGLPSAPLAATALSAPRAAFPGKVMITQVVPNDDSAVVFFTPVPGASDYRIYAAADPSKVKYAGEITHQLSVVGEVPRTPIAIEWNGIDPAQGADLVVEAVDKLGPFQKMDGGAGDGAMTMGAANMEAMPSEAINGQGDPSNVPAVLAQSAVFHVSCAPVSLPGSQAFFENFRNSLPFTRQPNPVPVDGSQYFGEANDYAVYANDKWEIRQYGADLTNSRIVVMGDHFMDTLYDGGGVGSPNPAHTNDASLVMMPKATADLSGGKVLHVTFEVDSHMDDRRWCELMIGEPGDTLIDCAKFSESGQKPTSSGRLLRWQIKSEAHTLQAFLGDGNRGGVDLIQPADWTDGQSVARILWDHVGPFANGTVQDLDKRHRFDLYLSKTHYRLQETTPDGLYNVVREKDFPAGVRLPFDKCQLYFVHQVYHTANDIQELTRYYPYNSYWTHFRPYSDERHWDNLGFEVLSAFPAAAKRQPQGGLGMFLAD